MQTSLVCTTCLYLEAAVDACLLPAQHDGRAARDIHIEGRGVEVCTVILQHVSKAGQAGTDGQAEFQQEAEQEVVLSLQTSPGTTTVTYRSLVSAALLGPAAPTQTHRFNIGGFREPSPVASSPKPKMGSSVPIP